MKSPPVSARSARSSRCSQAVLIADLPMFGLSKDQHVTTAEKPHYEKGEVVVVQAIATGDVIICANFSVSDVLCFWVPPFAGSLQGYLVKGDPAQYRILGSVTECARLRVGAFTLCHSP